VNLPSTTDLAEFVDKRHRCLLQLRDLGHKQAEWIAAGEMGPLLRLIAAKNQLISALQSIEQGLAPYHDQDPEQRSWSTPEARVQCAQQAEACQRLLSEVMELERQNEQNMIARRDHVASQLQTAQAAGTARGAYHAGTARGAYQAHQFSTPQGPHRTQTTPIAPLANNLSADDSPGHWPHGHQLDLHSDA